MEEHAGSLVNLLVALEPQWLRPYLPLEVVTGWLILLLVVLVAWYSVRHMQRVPASGWQTLAEWTYGLCNNFSRQMIGPGGERYAPLLGTLFVYILIMNLAGLVPGLTSPTATLNMTLALALTAVISSWVYGVLSRGPGYLGHFVEGVGDAPKFIWPLLVPIMIIVHLIGEFARIISLSIRLFGNIFAKETVIGQVLLLLASVLAMHQVNLLLRAPLVLAGSALLHLPLLLLGLLVSLIQAVIFVMLTAVYIQGAVEVHAE